MGAAPDIRNTALDSASDAQGRPELKLLPGGGNQGKPNRWNAILTSVCVLGLVLALHSAIRQASDPKVDGTQSIDRLTTIYKRFGTSRYFKEKRALAQEIERGLKDKSPETLRASRNVAILLFPELLSDEVFEKSVALEGWFPRFEQIELDPGSPAAKAQFLLAEAELGTFENPKGILEAWSPETGATLRLFQTISGFHSPNQVLSEIPGQKVLDSNPDAEEEGQ